MSENLSYGPYKNDESIEILLDLFDAYNDFSVIWSKYYKLSAVMYCEHIVFENMVDILYVGQFEPSPIVAPLVEELIAIDEEEPTQDPTEDDDSEEDSG